MSKESSTARSGGISFTGLLTVCFIVLKLTGYINWSWVWVLSPLWIGFLVGIFILAVSYSILLKLDKES